MGHWAFKENKSLGETMSKEEIEQALENIESTVNALITKESVTLDFTKSKNELVFPSDFNLNNFLTLKIKNAAGGDINCFNSSGTHVYFKDFTLSNLVRKVSLPENYEFATFSDAKEYVMIDNDNLSNNFVWSISGSYNGVYRPMIFGFFTDDTLIFEFYKLNV